LVPRVRSAPPGRRVRLVLQAPKVRLVFRARPDLRDRLVSQDPSALPVRPVPLAFRGPQGLQARKV
jgi:hypothetical protein